MNELEAECKNEHIRDLYRGVNEFKEMLQLWSPCVIFRKKKKSFFYGELASRPTLKLENNHLSAVTTAYSIYSQLPSTFGGCLIHP
jgi:hypothetical protein